MFDSSFFGQPSISMSDIKMLASSISDQYLADKIEPTITLTKIARERSLTPHQVEVLAGEANRCIHTAKYASAEDKYHAADFPLADAKEAIRTLQVGEVKVASDVSQGFADPVVSHMDAFAAFGVKEEQMDKTAEEKCALRKEAESCALLLEKQKDAEFMAKVACKNAENDFIKTARNFVLDGLDSKDRLSKLATVIHAVKCCGLSDRAARPLAKVAYALGAEGYISPDDTKKTLDFLLEKKADVTAPEGLISEFLPAKVVNGTHPLIVTLKTFADAEEREAIEAKRRGMIDDKARIYAQKIRAL